MNEKQVIRVLISNIKEEIQNIATAFYQRKDTEAYQSLNIFIQKMTELMKQLDAITDEYTQTMNLILSEVLKALQEKDGVLIADILRYDLNRILNQINMEL